MIEQIVTVSNRAGVHARPSSLIVETAQRFQCRITFTQGSMQINAKSILGIITLGATYQSKITITCDGPDEKEALAAIIALFDNKFEEED
jgi:phosphocarrier protein